MLGRGDHLPLPFLGYPGRDLEAEHARITRQGTGQFLLEDNHSRLGTRLNGQPVQTATPLKDGDLIKLGTNIIRFHSRQWGRLRAAAAAIASRGAAPAGGSGLPPLPPPPKPAVAAGGGPSSPFGAPRSAAARCAHASRLAITAGGLPAGIAAAGGAADLAGRGGAAAPAAVLAGRAADPLPLRHRRGAVRGRDDTLSGRAASHQACAALALRDKGPLPFRRQGKSCPLCR